jgi:hypothetical protein
MQMTLLNILGAVGIAFMLLSLLAKAKGAVAAIASRRKEMDALMLRLGELIDLEAQEIAAANALRREVGELIGLIRED